MATITTSQYLEDTARSAGEAMTLNGAILTVRTDTRWHANSPASMTGSLGSITQSATLGGGYYIDATNVRWLAISGGSGTAAIGDTISQGGVSGYFLGFWASLTSTPSTTIGATGFIKLREVTGGAFSAGALTFSGSGAATADGADVTGWIEVVHDQAATLTVPRLGKFQTRGDWFYLDNTTGSANQLIQVPTNGSATAYVPAVWIETGVGTGIYDKYPALFAAGMSTTNLGTDGRSKFVCMETDGQIRVGHNGTDTVGYVPPAGCKVRIPNILGRQCVTTTRATNAIPHATIASRPEFATTTAGAIDVEYFAGDWYFNLSQPYSVKMHHWAGMNYLLITECATAIDLDDCVIGHPQSLGINALYLLSNFAGGTVSNSNLPRYSTVSNGHSIYIFYCKDITLNNVTTGIIQYARSTGYTQITQSTNITLQNCTVINQRLQLTTAIGCSVLDHTHIDRYVGTTNTTIGLYAISIASTCSDILCDGLTFNDTYANTHPYAGVYSVGQSSNIKIRNLGTRSAFVDGGSANNPAYIFLTSGNNDTVKLQRLYMTPTRTGVISIANSDNNVTYEHVYGDFADAINMASLNAVAKNCGGTNGTSGQASVYGTHFWDAFTSDTIGRIVLSMNEPTAQSSSLVTVVNGTPKFTSAGQLTMQTLNDEIIIESSYFVKGVTALPSTTPVVTGTNVTYSSGASWGNHDIYYQIDKGSGYSGTWQDFTSTNLNAEDTGIDPAIGIRMKYRIVCNTTSTTNALTYIRMSTTSTLVAQTDNLYPLDTVTLTVSGIVSGSDVVIYQAGTETVLGSVDAQAGTSWNYVYETPTTVDVGVFLSGYVPFFIRGLVLGTTDASVPVAQVVDRAYLV